MSCSEFQITNFGLTHEPIDDFFRSQRVCVTWIIYRWALVIFFTIGLIGSLTLNFYGGLWFIYLTHWGFAICMLVNLMGAIMVTIYISDAYKFETGNFVVKAYWLLHFTTVTSATVITVVYWIFIFTSDFIFRVIKIPDDESQAYSVFNIWVHGFNSLLMWLDHMLVAFPTRIYHTIYPFIFGLLFGLFSYIYYLADGEDPYGNHYIYHLLDWHTPVWAILSTIAALALSIFFSIILYGLYRLRLYLYHKCVLKNIDETD